MKLNRSLVLVRVDQPAEKNADGIYIQEEWKKVPPTGTVEQVASDVTFCKPGDRIEFERYSALRVSSDEELRLCREDMVLAVL